MLLDEYRKKRDFKQSPEPKGEINIISKEDIKENEEKIKYLSILECGCKELGAEHTN